MTEPTQKNNGQTPPPPPTTGYLKKSREPVQNEKKK